MRQARARPATDFKRHQAGREVADAEFVVALSRRAEGGFRILGFAPDVAPPVARPPNSFSGNFLGDDDAVAPLFLGGIERLIGVPQQDLRLAAVRGAAGDAG